MSSQASKHHTGQRNMKFFSQRSDERTGMSYSNKLKLWHVYHHFKTPNITDVSDYFTTKEEAEKRLSEFKK